MSVKVGIHNGRGKAKSWNTSWIAFCEEQKIPHVVLDGYSPSIIEDLKKNEITHFLWAFSLMFHKDLIMARSVLFSVEKMGIKVYPNLNTSWHFEDKIAQKYLLESVDAPIVPSWAFYELEEALKWLKNEAKFPLVAKLRRGAGSHNVKL